MKKLILLTVLFASCATHRYNQAEHFIAKNKPVADSMDKKYYPLHERVKIDTQFSEGAIVEMTDTIIVHDTLHKRDTLVWLTKEFINKYKYKHDTMRITDTVLRTDVAQISMLNDKVTKQTVKADNEAKWCGIWRWIAIGALLVIGLRLSWKLIEVYLSKIA